MTSPNILVLDANILIRAVLGNKIRELLLNNSNMVNFFTPDICLQDAKKYLPVIFEKRGLTFEPAFKILSNLECSIQIVDETIYQETNT